MGLGKTADVVDISDVADALHSLLFRPLAVGPTHTSEDADVAAGKRYPRISCEDSVQELTTYGPAKFIASQQR